MSWEWDEFKARRDREGLCSEDRRGLVSTDDKKGHSWSKRKRLFNPQEEDIFEYVSDEDNQMREEQSKGRKKQPTRRGEHSNEYIDSFGSDEDEENHSSKVHKPEKLYVRTKGECKKIASQMRNSGLVNKSLTKKFVPSPVVISSSNSCEIEEFSSSDSDSVIEATPPFSIPSANGPGSPSLKPGSMFQTQQSRTKYLLSAAEKICVINVKRVEAAKTLDKEFDQFKHFQVVKNPEPNIECSDQNSKNMKARDWLSNIKSPEMKIEVDDGDSARKTNMKFPVGSLARRGQRLGNFNRGEHMMWLHHTTAAPHISPITEFCFAGEVVSVYRDTVGCQIINTSWDGLDDLNVNIVISKFTKQTHIKIGQIIIVYPEFYKVVHGSTFYIVSLFHHQSYDRTHPHLNNFDLSTMFLKVAKSFIPENSDDIRTHSLDEKILPLTAMQHTFGSQSVAESTNSCLVGISVNLCIYNIVIKGDKYELTCIDSANSPVIVTLDHSHKLWNILSSALKHPVNFTDLTLVFRSKMSRSFQHYPSLQMLNTSMKQCLVNSLKSSERTVVTLADEPFYNTELLSEHFTDRQTIVAKYLHTLKAKSVTISFASSAFGTIQSIEHQINLSLSELQNMVIEFSNLKVLTSHTFQFDQFSSYEVYYLSEKPPYPFISKQVEESQLNIYTNIKYCLQTYNQHTPIFSLCMIKFYVNQIRYEGRLYHVTAMTESVKATVLVNPQTIRLWLGTEVIAETSLKCLVGKSFEIIVVVTGNLKLYNIDVNLFPGMF